MTARTDHLDTSSFATRAMPSVSGLDRVTAVLASGAQLVDDRRQGNRHCKKLASARSPNSLYGRGVAKLRNGDTAGGEADIAAAKAIKADIATVYAGYGVKQSRICKAR